MVHVSFSQQELGTGCDVSEHCVGIRHFKRPSFLFKLILKLQPDGRKENLASQLLSGCYELAEEGFPADADLPGAAIVNLMFQSESANHLISRQT